MMPKVMPAYSAWPYELEIVKQIMTFKHDELEKTTVPRGEKLKMLEGQIALNDAAMHEKIVEIESSRKQHERDHDRVAGMQKELALMREKVNAKKDDMTRLVDGRGLHSFIS